MEPQLNTFGPANRKAEIRRQISRLKKECTPEQRREWSDILLCRLEEHPLFRATQTVLLYHSLPDEVCTHRFIEKWSSHKQLLLPVVKAHYTLELRRYTGPHDLSTGAFGISEPVGPLVTDYRCIDLALIPGVAFDCCGNRLGRGKGYYDRLLPHLQAPKIGLCFDFQFLSEPLPAEATDIPMDQVLTESRRITVETPTIRP